MAKAQREGTPEYTSWAQMRSRCSCPGANKYARYGGRGITVCARWASFDAFLADMGKKPSPTHSIDRYPDKDGNYEPQNCRWATPAEQSRNRGDNKLLTLNGETMCITDWAARLGTKATNLYSRIRLGWTIEKVLTTPIDKKLTQQQADQIKQLLNGRNGAEVARQFGVSRATVSLIRNGKIWT